MIHFVGAGPGAEDLITVRGQRYLEQADVVIYAGSLVNPGLLKSTKETCEIYNSAKMTLEEVLEVMEQAEREQKMTVRLHTGDPCLYGAIREQMDHLDELGIAYDSCPGVSSFCGAAAALNLDIHFRRCHRVLSSHVWKEEHRFRRRKRLQRLQVIMRRWYFS